MPRNCLYAIVLSVTLLLAGKPSLSAQGDPMANPADSAWIAEHYEKKQVRIPMRDGVELFTSILSPKDKRRPYPILLNRTPYTCAPYDEKNIPPRRYHTLMHLFRAGYIMVTQDVRGKYMSEGTFEDVRPHIPNKTRPDQTDESSDTYDTIDWLLKNVVNNNGKVGIYGISYPGFYATASLPDAHPALACVSPQAPVTDWFIGDDFHHNGAFFLADGFDFYYAFGQPRPEPTTEHSPSFTYPEKDLYRFFLGVGAFRNFDERYMRGKIKFWNDVTAHPNYDDFWKARDIRRHLHNIRPAVMTVGGLFDAEDCWGAFATFKAIEAQSPATYNVLVDGPWVHGGWHRTAGDKLGDIHFGGQHSAFFRDSIELPFFEHFLKGMPKPDLPKAFIFQTGSNRWKRYDAWPPKGGTQERVFYFGENKRLSTTPPAQEWAYDPYTSDPANPVPHEGGLITERSREYMVADQRFAAARPDVLSYATAPLTEDMTIIGAVTADLFLTTTATDADFVVKVIDVFPEDAGKSPATGIDMAGYQMLVRGEIMRARYRNSLEKPEALLPGRMEKVRLVLPDMAHTFKKGHRMMVQVQSSWFPLVDRNPQQFVDIYRCSEEDFRSAEHQIHRSAGFPSAIRVQVEK